MGPKKQGFWPRINCSQMKLPNFGSPSGDSLSKIGRHLPCFLGPIELVTQKVNIHYYIGSRLK